MTAWKKTLTHHMAESSGPLKDEQIAIDTVL